MLLSHGPGGSNVSLQAPALFDGWIKEGLLAYQAGVLMGWVKQLSGIDLVAPQERVGISGHPLFDEICIEHVCMNAGVAEAVQSCDGRAHIRLAVDVDRTGSTVPLLVSKMEPISPQRCAQGVEAPFSPPAPACARGRKKRNHVGWNVLADGAQEDQVRQRRQRFRLVGHFCVHLGSAEDENDAEGWAFVGIFLSSGFPSAVRILRRPVICDLRHGVLSPFWLGWSNSDQPHTIGSPR